MKWLVRLGVALGVTLGLFVVIGFMLPSEYRVERSVNIEASKEQVHALVGDLSRWPTWEPWREDDPTIVTTLGEQTVGVGAHQRWTGDSGSGELTFTRSSPDAGIEFDLVFDGEWICVGYLTYADHENGVTVTWGMKGDVGMNLVGRYFNLLVDAMAGPMFERGLEKLQTAAPAEPVAAAALAADVAPPAADAAPTEATKAQR